MVLHKRKHVGVAPPPDGLHDSQEIWSIPATGEVFTEYEKFLKRMDFLNQKKFTDAVNGKSALTYFEALKLETESSEAIENVFPECLRDPILRKVQFSTTSRMDDLVNLVFDEFKKDFFPGENVIIVTDGGDMIPGTVREKAKFPMIRGPDGEIQRYAFSRYFVRMGPGPDEEALTDEKHLRRDRKVFTKQNLRSFLKNSLQRESWNGAPWLVKEHLAIHYRLPMEIPLHLLQDYKVLQQKQQILQSKPGAKTKKKIAVEDIIRPSIEEDRVPQASTTPGEFPPKEARQGYHAAKLPPSLEALKAPPAVIKYPIEDLDLSPKQDGVTRPQLSFFTEEMQAYVMGNRRKQLHDVHFDTLGSLLEIWNTLNVQCEVYILDSFTFDDFVDAMRYTADEPGCELLEEVFCAVLKQLVNEAGKLQVTLPALDESESEDESEESNLISEPSTPADEPPARSTRSSRPSAVSLNGIKAESPVVTKTHRATELLEGYDWQAQLAAREVELGGWQMILVGLLTQLSYAPHMKSSMDKVLAYLAPLEEEPTRDNLIQHFASMDINLKTLALQTITLLSISTKALKDFLESCSEDQTDTRKRKIEHQRERKEVMAELAAKDRERKILLPDNMIGTPEPEVEEAASPDVEMEDAGDEERDSDSDIDTGRTLRRNAGRKRKREEDAARVEKEKAERARQAANAPKQSKEFLKILKDIEKLRGKIQELEHKIDECDNDLREANVQRTRVLGSDRYCNRYYWFERNGQPFGGLPTSSTAEYGYANGRIWVQGPSEMEREGFIDLPSSLQAQYEHRHHLTVPQRRKQEEGATILQNAHEWGFYDDPDRLDALIGWLDDRGEREKKLLKELRDWRDEIAKYMEIRKTFLEEEAVKRSEAEDEQATRISTRHAVQKDRSAAAERCLRWSNTMMLESQRHLHSQNPPRAKQKKAAKGVAVLTNRSKAATRSSFGR